METQPVCDNDRVVLQKRRRTETAQTRPMRNKRREASGSFALSCHRGPCLGPGLRLGHHILLRTFCPTHTERRHQSSQVEVRWREHVQLLQAGDGSGLDHRVCTGLHHCTAHQTAGAQCSHRSRLAWRNTHTHTHHRHTPASLQNPPALNYLAGPGPDR